jgi:hypothetical protein
MRSNLEKFFQSKVLDWVGGIVFLIIFFSHSLNFLADTILFGLSDSLHLFFEYLEVLIGITFFMPFLLLGIYFVGFYFKAREGRRALLFIACLLYSMAGLLIIYNISQMKW